MILLAVAFSFGVFARFKVDLLEDLDCIFYRCPLGEGVRAFFAETARVPS